MAALDAWTDAENDAIVADYFAMLDEDMAGRTYIKSERRRALAALIGRGEGSIEYRHQNISTFLKGLGETWIDGYKTAFNFQASMIDSLRRKSMRATLLLILLHRSDGSFRDRRSSH